MKPNTIHHILSTPPNFHICITIDSKVITPWLQSTPMTTTQKKNHKTSKDTTKKSSSETQIWHPKSSAKSSVSPTQPLKKLQTSRASSKLRSTVKWQGLSKDKSKTSWGTAGS
jgi:hypothetical protein